MPDNKQEDLTQGSVFHHLLRLLIPFSFALFAMMSAGLVDSLYIGHLGKEPLAAMGFVLPLMFLVQSVSIGLGAGASSVVSRAAGEKDQAKLQRRAMASLCLTFFVMLTISVLGMIFIDPILAFLGASDNVQGFARSYMHIWLLSPLISSVPMIAGSILRATGQAFWPSMIMVLAALINAILDPFLIFGLGPFPRMEMGGAALATVVGNIFALGFAFILLKRSALIHFSCLSRKSLVQSWKEIARVGLPASASNAIGPIAITLATAGLARLAGEAAIAGYGAGSRLEMFIASPLFALSAVIGPMTGQNGGAHKSHRVRRTFITAFTMCLVWGFALGLAIIPFATPLARLFSQDAEVIRVIALYFSIVPASLAGYGCVIAASAGFNALGRPWTGLVMTIGRSLVLFMPGVWLGAALAGVVGSWLAIALANSLAGLAVVFWTLKYGPVTVREIPESE